MATDTRSPVPLDMIYGILRAVIPPALTYVVAKGWIPEASGGDVMAALSAVGAAIWSVYLKTDSSKMAAVEAIPDVAKIVAKPSPDPNGAVAEAIDDPDRPKVVNSIGMSNQIPSQATSSALKL